LPDEGLVDIEENVAALDDHALNGQVLSDVFRLAHFIMHDLAGKQMENINVIVIILVK